MKDLSQSKIRRDTKVNVLVSNELPYKIVNTDGDLVGYSLQANQGVYLHNVNFKVVDGQPLLEGRFKGFLEELRVNLSKGSGIMFDPSKKAFTDGEKEIRTARMVQVYNGIIKVVLN